MREVFRALKGAGFVWKSMEAHRVRVRWVPQGRRALVARRMQVLHERGPDSSGNSGGAGDREGAMVDDEGAGGAVGPSGLPRESSIDVSHGEEAWARARLVLQLYRVQDRIYLLDLRRAGGDVFSFMNLCARLIAELKEPGAAGGGAGPGPSLMPTRGPAMGGAVAVPGSSSGADPPRPPGA